MFIIIFVPQNTKASEYSPESQKIVVHHIADSLFENKKYEEALQFYQKAIEIYQLNKQWEQEITCLNASAKTLRKTNELDEALATINQSIDIGIKHLPDKNEHLAMAFHIKSLVFHSQGDYYKAIFSEQEAIKRWKIISGEDNYNIAKGYNPMGICYKNVGRLDKSLHFYKEALKISEKLLDSLHPSIASIINNICTVYFEKGDFDQALNYSKKAIDITLRTNPLDSVLLAKKYNNMGMIFIGMKDTTSVYKYYKLALDIRRRTLDGDHPDLAGSYNNMGRINRIMGNYDTALVFYNKALKIYKEYYKGRHPDIAMCYNNMANIYKEKEIYDSAIHFNTIALNIRTEFYRINHPDIANCFLTFGDIYERMGQYEEALNYLELASNSNILEGKILSSQEQLLILSKKIKVFVHRFDKISADTNDLVKAIEVSEEISGLIDEQRKSYKSKGSMLTLNNSVSDIFFEAIRISYRLYKLTNNKVYFDKAFFFAEKNRANVLVEAILESRSHNFSGILDSLISQEKELKRKLQLCDQERQSEIFHKGKRNRDKIIALESEFKQLNNTYDSLIQVFEKNYKNYFHLRYNTSILSPQEVKMLLPSGTALIEYVTADSLLFIITFAQKDLFITRVQIDSLDYFVNELRNTLSQLKAHTNNNQISRQYCELSYQLYNVLFKPVEEQINGQDLIIIPDGKLGYIPFEVLLSDNPDVSKIDFRDFPYLIKKHVINYGNSATIQLQLLNTLTCDAKNNFLGIAPFTNQVRDLITNDTLILTSLPASYDEVESIKKLIGGKIYQDTVATKNNFLSDARNFRILHIATHGFVNDKEPLESCLFFYPAFPSRENTLKIKDLFNLNLGSEMAVLSACNTGIGNLENGEGIMSLARGFSYAGVPGVAMSLWNVNDKSTSKIMFLFYDYLKKGYKRNEALRQAKLDYIRQADNLFATPYYWGGFVYIGKNEMIHFSDKRSGWWYLLLIIPIVGIVYFASKRKSV